MALKRMPVLNDFRLHFNYSKKSIFQPAIEPCKSLCLHRNIEKCRVITVGQPVSDLAALTNDNSYQLAHFHIIASLQCRAERVR